MNTTEPFARIQYIVKCVRVGQNVFFASFTPLLFYLDVKKWTDNCGEKLLGA